MLHYGFVKILLPRICHTLTDLPTQGCLSTTTSKNMHDHAISLNSACHPAMSISPIPCKKKPIGGNDMEDPRWHLQRAEQIWNCGGSGDSVACGSTTWSVKSIKILYDCLHQSILTDSIKHVAGSQNETVALLATQLHPPLLFTCCTTFSLVWWPPDSRESHSAFTGCLHRVRELAHKHRKKERKLFTISLN